MNYTFSSLRKLSVCVHACMHTYTHTLRKLEHYAKNECCHLNQNNKISVASHSLNLNGFLCSLLLIKANIKARIIEILKCNTMKLVKN